MCVVVLVALTYGLQLVDAQVITYRIHPDIFTELQDRYPEYAEEYWESVKDAIRDGISAWTALNSNIIFTPSHDDRYDVLVEWIDSEYVWGVEYHDSHLGYRIGIDFDAPEPDMYGASLINPDIVRYIMAHELGHLLGLGHSIDNDHLMYGKANPTPERVFDDLGYTVPYVSIDNFENIGGDQIDVSFHLQGYHVYDVVVMDINGTQYVVASTGDEGLHVLNMSNPIQPRPVWSDGDMSTDIESLEGQPYIVQMHSDGFRVLDASDPANVTLAGAINHNTIRDAILIDVDGIPLMVTISTGLIQQYDLSNPYDIRRSGAYADDFHLLGVRSIYGVVRDDGSTYVVVNASFDGIQHYLIQPDRNPAPAWNRLSLVGPIDALHGITPAQAWCSNQVECVNHVREVIEINDATYRVSYTDDQIILYEGESGSDFIGRLLGYTALEIDTLRVDGTVYAIVAVGSDGILGLYIGDENAGKWTVN